MAKHRGSYTNTELLKATLKWWKTNIQNWLYRHNL